MSRSTKWRLEWAFFLGENGRRQYNHICKKGVHAVSYTHLDVYKRQSQTLIPKGGAEMENRKSNIQMKFYVTQEEKRLNDEKMKQLPIKQYGAYFRKMAIDGYILVVRCVEETVALQCKNAIDKRRSRRID